MQEHETKEAMRAVNDVSPQLEQGWFPLANQWAELLSKSKLNGSQFRLVFWWFRNAYGRMRKIMAHWPGAKKVGVEIGMNEDQVKRTLAGMCRAGMFKRKGDEIYIVKNWLTWEMWKWIDNIPENTYPQNPQSYQQPPQGANPSPPSGGQTVTRNGANQSPDINKVVKERKITTHAHGTRGGEIGLLIAEFQMSLRNKLKEEPTSFNRGAAGKGFKRLLGSFQRHEIQARFNQWFISTDAHVERRGWRVEDFFTYFNRLKDGPIVGRQDDRRTLPSPAKPKYQPVECEHCGRTGFVGVKDETGRSSVLACTCLNGQTYGKDMVKWNGQPTMVVRGRTLKLDRT